MIVQDSRQEPAAVEADQNGGDTDCHFDLAALFCRGHEQQYNGGVKLPKLASGPEL